MLSRGARVFRRLPAARLLAEALTEREKTQLNDLLRRVMLVLEQRFPPKPS